MVHLEAIRRFRKGENVFLTGPGGSGKTTLIRRMYEDAIQRKKKVQVTALTGCAAILLKCKARTIHSFAGIGLGNGKIEEIVSRVCQNSQRVRTWKSVQILIVDEISMMSRKLLETLDAVAKKIRQSDKPFGGIQVIFSGDFFQIKPVGRMEEPSTLEYCFESPLWNLLFTKSQHILLTTIFRQKDEEYTKILNQIRNGCLDEEGAQRLRHLMGRMEKETIVKPIKLLPTRRQVDNVNQQELEKLESATEHRFEMVETNPKKESFLYQKELEFLKRSVLCEEVVSLRVGAQVMCIVNKTLNEVFLCNGSQGTVVGFSEDGFPVVQFKNGFKTVMEYHEWQSEVFPEVSISQIPLILAWAVTIHKAQGATLETAEIDVGKSIFECGQMYVALSRIKDMEGLYLKSFDRRSLMVDPKVQAFYRNISC